jgi:propionyl-CoA carboxylase alpha chain
MRVVAGSREFRSALDSARREAQGAFGDDRLLLEKYLERPRHIEVQIFADRHGNAIHLFDRDCSIQRRYQKVVEEAPAPGLEKKMRCAMAEAAIAAARAVGYVGAGTVELIVERDRFYFMEMNTRLQVEHPVTELVTGIDLVEQMIRIAAGEKLAFKQTDVKFSGWAVESRIYAEDPYRNFLPSTGRLTRYRPPQEGSASGVTVRNDTGVYEGGEISLYYDPMIAKLVTSAPTRAAAIAAQSDALDEFVIDGIRHNIPFIAALMAHPRWQAGKLSTAFIIEEFPGGFHPQAPQGETAQVLAAVAAAIDHVLGERKRRISGQLGGTAVTRESERVVWLGEQDVRLAVKRENGVIEVRFHDGKARACRVVSDWKPVGPVWNGTVDDYAVTVQVRGIPNGFALSCRGVETRAYVYTEREAGYARLMPARKVNDTGKQVICPMPGLVVSITVKEGQEVKAGETVAVVEAMKMENVLRAEIDGTVKKISAKPGDSLAVDAVILEFA